MKKIFLFLISPVLLVIFIVGVIIYRFTKSTSTTEFVFDIIEKLMD